MANTYDPELQPELLPEDRAAYQLTAKAQKEKEAYRQRRRADCKRRERTRINKHTK